jgi:hypothetical protein
MKEFRMHEFLIGLVFVAMVAAPAVIVGAAPANDDKL